MELEIRKTQSDLVSAGIGILLFAVWSVLRSIMYYMNSSDDIREMSEMISTSENATAGSKAAAVTIVVILTALDLLFRVYISRKAIAEGKGNRSGSRYLRMSVMLMLIYLGSIVMHGFGIAGMVPGYKFLTADNILSITIDLTSLYILFLMFYSAFRLRKLLKQQAENRTAT